MVFPGRRRTCVNRELLFTVGKRRQKHKDKQEFLQNRPTIFGGFSGFQLITLVGDFKVEI